MTKKLVWRLSKLPTVDELRGLVQDKTITQEEAKEILFKSETEEDRDKSSLESEIKFLRELVEKLSKSRSEIVTVIKEVEKPVYRNYPYWEKYWTWCNSAISTYTDSNGTSFPKGTVMSSNFSDIKSF